MYSMSDILTSPQQMVVTILTIIRKLKMANWLICPFISSSDFPHL